MATASLSGAYLKSVARRNARRSTEKRYTTTTSTHEMRVKCVVVQRDTPPKIMEGGHPKSRVTYVASFTHGAIFSGGSKQIVPQRFPHGEWSRNTLVCNGYRF